MRFKMNNSTPPHIRKYQRILLFDGWVNHH